MRRLKRLFTLLSVLVVSIALGAAALYAQRLLDRPDLQPWHALTLRNQFNLPEHQTLDTLPEYLALESRLFAELRSKLPGTGLPPINR